jgi:hypothetical protein
MTAKQSQIYRNGVDAFYLGCECSPPYSSTLNDIQNRCLWVAGYHDAKVWGVK